MEQEQKKLLEIARPETKPRLPYKIRWKSKLFGNGKTTEYLWKYYEKESEHRIPFYLPYIYGNECLSYLRRYGQLSKKQIRPVLIDDGDYRIDYFLKEFMEELNELTILTNRKEYFEGLQERAFQELGLLIDLREPWEEKELQGNLVWDFTEKLQRPDCYPKGSLCFLPHKKEWKIRELLNMVPDITAVSLLSAECGGKTLSPALAESMLVPQGVTFRGSRCKELEHWCKSHGLSVKLRVQNLEKP